MTKEDSKGEDYYNSRGGGRKRTIEGEAVRREQ